MASTVRTARPLAANRAFGRAALCGGCVALAVASLALPSAPSFDPWAWLVFGKELATPGPGFSTVAHTGWKPLAVLFTAPLSLAGSAAPSLWLVVVRVAGLAALTLAFRLAARAGGAIAGVLAALALLAGSDWLRYLSAGNVEPLVVALMLGAIELHLAPAAGSAFLLVALAGLARPEVWLLVIAYAAYLLLSERRWWPLALGIPGMFALWIVPDWLGSGDLLHTFHLARISAEPRSLQGTGDPALELLRGAAGIEAGTRVDRGAVRTGLGLAQARSHRGGPRSGRHGLGAADRGRHGDGLPGGPPLPRRSRRHRRCVLAGIGLVAVTRLASRSAAPALRWRRPWSPSAPRSPSPARSISGTRRAPRRLGPTRSRRCGGPPTGPGVAPVARLHPVIQPSGMANGLAQEARPPPGPRRRMVLADRQRRLHRRRRSPRDRAAATPQRNGDTHRGRAPRGMCCWFGGGRGRLADEPGP